MASFTPRQAAAELDGVRTVVFVQSYADRTLVLVTQVGKVGRLIQASLPATAPLLPPAAGGLKLPEPSPAIQLTPLLGSAPSEHLQTLHGLYVAQIASIIWAHDAQLGIDDVRRSVVVGLALAKRTEGEEGITTGERETFEGVMKLVNEVYCTDTTAPR